MELYILAVGIYCDFFYIELYILLFIENIIWNSINIYFFLLYFFLNMKFNKYGNYLVS